MMHKKHRFGRFRKDNRKSASSYYQWLVCLDSYFNKKTLLSFIILTFIILNGCEKNLIPSYTESQSNWKDLQGPLIQYCWTQDNPYAAQTPGQELLGCWSIAFAQVLAFHNLQPLGRVCYRTHGGHEIDEVLNRPVEWDRIVKVIYPNTPTESVWETTQYCYLAAVTVQKDFGRGEYMDISRVPEEVSEHYNCVVKRIEAGAGNNLINIVRSELNKTRPLIVYFDDILDVGIVRTGHAAILDGIAEDGSMLFVHVCFGWGGASDGWYDFEHLAEERELLCVFCIEPK